MKKNAPLWFLSKLNRSRAPRRARVHNGLACLRGIIPSCRISDRLLEFSFFGLSLFPVFGELTEHSTIRRVAEPSVAGISAQLLPAIPNGLRFVHPPQPLIVR